MPKRSAGLLVYRRRQGALEVFLVHPGGPFWAKKDLGAWSIPKGEYLEGEEPLQAALREFEEETGIRLGAKLAAEFIGLGVLTQAGGKIVSAWACEGDFNPQQLVSNTCEIEWPPRSGRRLRIPEVDRGAWFSIAEAEMRILKSQQPILEKLVKILEEQTPY
jgi:predicted NUDIX family NTP pyrophosphohydrolase